MTRKNVLFVKIIMLRDVKGSAAEQIGCARHRRVLINDGWTGAIPN